MKTKQKLVLAIASLSAICAGAAATSTFAWFTTNKQTTVSYNNVKAVGTRGNLEVAIKKINTDAAETENADPATVITSASTVTDISSVNGLEFFQPSWATTAGNAKPVNQVNNVTDSRNAYYANFLVELSNTANGSLNVFIDDNTLIKAHDVTDYDKDHTKDDAEQGDKDSALAKWSRLAIANAGSDFADFAAAAAALPSVADGANGWTNKIILQGSAGGTKGIGSTTLTDSKATFSDVTASYTQTIGDDGQQVGAVPTVDDSSETTANNFVVTIAAESKVYCLVTIWLEGSAADDQDICKGGVIDTTIGFTAIDA